ncbi:MAG: tetratricopeptide repeat protein [Verrucomicrobiota bacterium]
MSQTATLDLEELEERVLEKEEEGQHMAAEILATAAIKEARAVQNGSAEVPVPLLHSLEVRGGLRMRAGEIEPAREDFLEALSLLDGREKQDGMLGRLHVCLGCLNEEEEKDGEAIEAYEKALGHFEKDEETEVEDVVRLSNNLAFLYAGRDEFDQAETLFLKALKLAHEELGASSEETTGVCNNVGALYQKSGHLSEAQEMHLLALEGRKECFGANHPDTAQSHGNLAVVLAELGEDEDAREHFEAALGIYQSLGEDEGEDYQSVASNYAQYLRLQGEGEAASTIEVA